jgi:hypothetical protein
MNKRVNPGRFRGPRQTLLTVVSCQSHRLGTIPARESVRRESGMDQGKVGTIQVMVEVVIVIVHLTRRELSLVDNVLG